MSLIKLEDTPITAITKMSAGIPGAITVLVQILKEAPAIDPQDFMGGFGPILALDTHRIYGSDIWLLYKDICGSSIPNMCAVLRAMQLGITPEEDVKTNIFAHREGLRLEQVMTKLDVPVIMAAVMERLVEFNRVPEKPDDAQIDAQAG